MNMKISKYILILLTAFSITSCGVDDEISKDSIFNTESPIRNELDTWILENYVNEYNIDLKYRFEDIESDMNYNVIPANYTKSVALAQLVKYLWMDVYTKIAGKTFLCTYCPKVMHFVGSPEYEAGGGSMVLGTAEGGMKITLFNVNGLDVKNPDMELLNEWYFKTMHHEFAHILHQTKNYSTDYITITQGKYTGPAWVNKTDSEMRKLGFVTAYGSTNVDEDFVEVIANYIVKSDSEWENILQEAGEEGATLINQKLDMVTEYLQESWGIDIKVLHDEVQYRQSQIQNFDWETLK